jgi:tRNA (adenine37-N6)-methyltransferase
VELFPGFEQGLKDIEGFERVWLLYSFDRASEPQLVVRPYLDPVERGIFATRSPARPNRIGMSPVGLLGVQGATLLVCDVDMLDGTPLLDIKPYVPAFDHFPVEASGLVRASFRGGSGCRCPFRTGVIGKHQLGSAAGQQ